MDRIQLIQLVEQAGDNNQKAIEELYHITYSVMYSLATISGLFPNWIHWRKRLLL